MARIARIVVPGHPHLVRQSSLDGKSIFPNTKSRTQYLELLEQYTADHKIAVKAFALLKSEVVLLLVPKDKDGLAKCMRRTHSAYGREAFPEGDTLWADRFESCPLQKDWLYAATKFVERAPVTAKLAKKAEAYAWSSAAAHAAKKSFPALDGWVSAPEKRKWSSWLATPLEDWEHEALETRLRRGYPVGDDAFVAKVS